MGFTAQILSLEEKKRMIDSIRLCLPLAAAEGLTGRLKDYRRRDINTGFGTIGTMKVYQSLDGVTFKGSLPKYLRGENITPISRAGVKAAIEKLETETGLNLSTAVVGSVEVGTSIILREKPAEYLQLFGDPAVFHKIIYTRGGYIETVLYSTPTGAFSFCAYDKSREMKAKRAPIPELFAGHNVLRLEYRIIRRRGIRAKLRRDLTAYDLFDYDTYRDLKDLFYKSYRNIPKTGRGVFIDTRQAITPARLEGLEAAQYRQTYRKEHNAMLQTFCEAGLITKKNLDRIRAMDRRQGRDYSISDKNPLIEELDGYIRTAAAYAG
jgi:hypothetical protein